ncbi:MAG: hypothetical protein A2528_00600 [Candidatus Staskawiczbacteria bacterium RIFOXYD2_FULL_37_9]|uniref:Uncharacterized protein n=1 Tax=Candidatus Staskawiczbacteria bacterium RIFOXYB1_FULL_37_44 TaxID=1802223 RepID=A0A1G2IWS4_9BACT|nr:MAG: hypothetical protein A2358_04030 [Candidatus Staskawiczbacteria bacterium RIFOXYB1_FULL_37_44]OGZ83799.1 MAG: hypothetical protein A2416_00265 [Candidatus Staskawiczbacteria bacterium RIFOXYC1_FULL_37_52]OGZ88948.1 MAG: hypothetical protein A2581_01755 [Candidatus Staskawiczbacteria bacterium RIFOXYD1_FULL_37_110]OGZ89590.1 MAG: hypothetical protein A2444_01495 [Candidatus Staskawiczbacteria bacterium RIFOXYC2_FULL_37_19]OGZ93278.1 MAG: hypothetical protein A2528_00600 [Candidatus Stask
MASYKKLFWTEHSKIKMRQYGLSKQKLLGILYRPERKEQGIAPGTSAVMKTNKTFFREKQITLEKALRQAQGLTTWQKPKKAPGEIWIMFKDIRKKEEGEVRKIISAWRYPGISKPGEEIPIPEDIKNEILNNLM